jgi:PilZ domain
MDCIMSSVSETRDISSGGVCFLSPTDVQVGGRIEYLITLSGSNPPVRIRCLGKVMRSRQPDAAEAGPEFEVAVTMDRYQFVREEPETKPGPV